MPLPRCSENIAERKEMNVCNENNFEKYSLIYSSSSIDGLAAHVLGKSWLMAHSSWRPNLFLA
jgi:hypothetical protein